MSRTEALLSVAAVLLGVCCLLLAATGLAGPSNVALPIPQWFLGWVPLLSLLCLAGTGLILSTERMKPGMSKRMVILFSVVASAVVIGAVALGLSAVRQVPAQVATATGDPSVPNFPAVQMTDGGGVQVQITFNRAAGIQDRAIAFQVSMSTHSVELSPFDLAKLSKIVLDTGATLTDFTWQPEGEGGGHHVGGTLIARDPQGLLAGARTITLEITGLPGDGVRKYQWKGNAR